MAMVNPGDRTLTKLDFGRLSQLTSARKAADLEELLSEAEVLDDFDIPADVVTMYAQAEIADMSTKRLQRFVLCYPDHAEPRDGHVSVLSPVGIALLGLRKGAVARWLSPAGEECSAELLAVVRRGSVGAAES